MALWLEFFATDETVARLEAALRGAESPAQRLSALMQLAWQLRQRDGARALALAQEAQALLGATEASAKRPELFEMPEAPHAPDPAEASDTLSMRARLDLLHAEIAFLRGDLLKAEALLARALMGFAQADDALGLGDAQWQEQMLCLSRGQPERAQLCNQEAQQHYLRSGDSVRLQAAKACRLFHLAFGDAEQASAGLDREFPDPHAQQHAAVDSWSLAARGLVKGMAGDSGAAARLFLQALVAAELSGQISLACVLAFNASNGFMLLNDLSQGLEWAERGLSLARDRQWPSRTGRGLEVTGNLLRLLGRYVEAQTMLQASLRLVNSVSAVSSNTANVQSALAQLALDTGDDGAALKWAQDCEATAHAVGMRETLVNAWGVQAKALTRLHRPDEAAVKLSQIFASAQEAGNPLWRVNGLRTLAVLYRQALLPLPLGVAPGQASLQALQEAITLARGISDFILPIDLLEEAAAESAQVGDLLQAYQLALEASRSHERIRSQEASNRAIALQVRYETDQLRHEGERQRLLAKTLTERAAALEQANSTLEQLGVIGREITGNLEASAIIAALDKHVHALLDAFAFAIYRLEPDGQTLRTVFGLENGAPLPQLSTRMDAEVGRVPLCARERREIVVHLQADGLGAHPVAGTALTLSMMFAPLLVGERLLGVMTIQSPRPQAYGEREIAIFRTLCAYGAIALANAEAQAQLIQSEKLASLGQLVASVAHEINSPIGAIKSSGASMVDALSDTLAGLPSLLQTLEPPMQSLLIELIEQASKARPLQSSREERAVVKGLTAAMERAGLASARRWASLLVQMGLQELPDGLRPLLAHAQCERMLQTVHGLSTVIRSAANINVAVERVAKIVFALKRFSRADPSGEWRSVDLVENIETVLTIYQHQIKQGFDLQRRYEPGLPLLPCLPDELNQVWTNLIHNALQAMPRGGRLVVAIKREGEALVVSVGDSGCGIPEAIRARIFDPFFTTKPEGEGSGLGLNIVKKIVEKHRGRIELHSEIGTGTVFSVYLPLV